VGQGDGVLVQAGGEDYLVDAGRAEQGPDVVDFLRSRGVGASWTAPWLPIHRFRRTQLGFNARWLEGWARSSDPRLEIMPGGRSEQHCAGAPKQIPS
jgi:hypothetical protein